MLSNSNRAIKALLLLSALALLAGCKSKPPITGPKTGYMYSNDDSARYVEWAQAGQRLEGEIQTWDRKSDGEFGVTLFSFNGTLSGDKVSLTLNGSSSRDGYRMIDKTIIRALVGNTLTLPPMNRTDGSESVVFRRATMEEYLDAAWNLQKRAKTTKTAK
ncbi:MAG TPA: hypothetical protein VJZ77_20560 [Blastocatellia bacterium]|nr:hypothetical protein [Blastocatellia bacterium]